MLIPVLSRYAGEFTFLPNPTATENKSILLNIAFFYAQTLHQNQQMIIRVVSLVPKFCEIMFDMNNGQLYTMFNINVFVGMAGNVACAVHAAAKLGSQAFGMFIKRQNQLQCPPLTNDEVSAFRKALAVGSSCFLVVL